MQINLAGFLLVLLFSLQSAATGQVKIEDHLLGESAEHFFSEAPEGMILSACAKGDFGKVNRSVKKTAKENCAWLSNVRQRMVSGASGKYKDEISPDHTNTTTYLFEAGMFVAAEILFTAPDATNNYEGKSFAEIFQGLKGTYGPPTSEVIVPYRNAYGVPYPSHKERWITASYAIQVDEQPGERGWTRVKASTREVYDQQLKMESGTKPPPNPIN